MHFQDFIIIKLKMLRLVKFFILTVICFNVSNGARNPILKELPQPCIEPRHNQANNCANQLSFRYIRENNTCVPVTDKHCRGHNRFTQSLECVYRCFDSSSFFEEVGKTMPDVLDLGQNEPTDSQNKQPTPSGDSDKGRGDELHGACKDRPSDCHRNSNAYKFDRKTRKCVPVNDRKCRGANRFTMREECEFVCLQNKGDVINRKWT
uniref:CSON004553 protein n=1 Tax=Culicoides sonorensis TaxID=179676 RepID=A0A336LXK7_CULSO